MLKKKISLITGVAGCIGSNLAENLLKNNHIVYGVDNLSLGKKKNLKNIMSNKNFFFKKINLKYKAEFFFNSFIKKKIDYLWLLAANSDIQKGVKNENIDINNTFFTTVNTIKGVVRKLNKKCLIIFTSSSAIYGNYRCSLNEENHNFNPISNYGKSKLLSEFFIKSYCQYNKILFLILRLPNVTGSPFTHGILSDFLKKFKKNKKILKVLGNGMQKKPYIHVKELVRAMFYLSNKIKKKSNIILIGPQKINGILIKKIANIFKNKINKRIKLMFEKKEYGWEGDVPSYSYLTKRLNSYSFRFRYSSEQAISYAVDQLKKNLIK